MPPALSTFAFSTRMALMHRAFVQSLAAGLVLAAPWAALAQVPSQGRPIRDWPIKVVILNRVQALTPSDGGVIVRRGGIEPFQMKDLREGLESFRTQLQNLAGPTVKVSLSITEDQDQATVWDAPDAFSTGTATDIRLGSQTLDSLTKSLVGEGIAPGINSDFFQTNEGIYLGPYRMVYVIHGGLVEANRTLNINGQPAALLGFYTWGQGSSKVDLPREMLRLHKAATGEPQVDLPPLPQTAAPSAYGEFEVKQQQGGPDGAFLSITSTGLIQRGWATLWKGENVPGGLFSLRIRTTAKDSISVSLIGDGGQTLASVMLQGQLRIPPRGGSAANIFRAPVTSDGNWQTLTLNTAELAKGAAVKEIRIGGAPYSNQFERQAFERSAYDISLPAAPQGQPAAVTPAAALQPPASDREILGLNGSISDTQLEAWKTLYSEATDTDRKASLLAVFTRVKDAKAVPILAVEAASGAPAIAAIACMALGAQTAPEAQAALEQIVRRGPFETNMRFAAEQLVSKQGVAYHPALSILMVQRGWRTRLAGARFLSSLKSQDATVVLITSLSHFTEPNAGVRLQIAQSVDLTTELAARRLLFSAVNDPSQWVRAAAAGRLIDSPFAQIRNEALQAVRDDSVTVRLYLLNLMTQRAQANYRPALRIAVIDPDLGVRAAALEAFAAQPDPVAPNEIQNTFQDADVRVMLALAKLAVKKRITLPAAVVQRLKASSSEEVRRAASELPG